MLALYYKCKRHNGTSGNDPADYVYYDAMKELLGHRPSVLLNGYESSQAEAEPSSSESMIPADVVIECYDYDNVPDFDGAIPGSSSSEEHHCYTPLPNTPMRPQEMESRSEKQKKKKSKIEEVLTEIREATIKNEKLMEEDRAQFQKFLDTQQQMLTMFSESN